MFECRIWCVELEVEFQCPQAVVVSADAVDLSIPLLAAFVLGHGQDFFEVFHVRVEVLAVAVEKDLSMWETRFDALFKQLNDVVARRNAQHTDGRECRLHNVEEAIEQLLIVVGAEQIEVFHDENYSLNCAA